MGFQSTTRVITLKARRKGRAFDGFRKFGPSFQQWEDSKKLLDRLLLEQRISGPLLRLKELQQYAEEIMIHAKKNTSVGDSVVESMLVSAEARQVLFEKLVPRYAQRPNMFTRVVNMWHRRDTDSTRIGMIEFVDRPGELLPAEPVGEARRNMISQVMDSGSRRERRRYEQEFRS